MNETFTNDELNKLRDAIFKIADAESAIRAIAFKAKSEGRWEAYEETNAAAGIIMDRVTGHEGCLNHWLQTL